MSIWKIGELSSFGAQQSQNLTDSLFNEPKRHKRHQRHYDAVRICSFEQKSTTAANSFSTRRRKQTTKDGLPLFVATSSTPRTTPAVFSDRHQPPMTFLLQLHDEVAVDFHSGKQHAGSRLLCCSWRKPLHSCHPALDVQDEVWVRPFVISRFYT